MPHEYLSEEKVSRYGRFVADPTAEELEKFFFLDGAALERAQGKRRPHDRLGWSIQWGTVRMLGTFLTDSGLAGVPEVVIRYVAEQLGIGNWTSVKLYGELKGRESQAWAMVLRSRRQAEVLEELEEWREDVRERGIGSRVVLLAVPKGWGRSEVLTRFRDLAGDADGPVTVVAGIDGNRPGGRAVQATGLQEVLAEITPPSRAAELLDLDTPAGKAELGLDVAGWFVPGLAAAVSVTMLSRLLGAAGRMRDDGPAGEAGAVARAARAVAAVSVKVPVVVVIDNADLLDAGLARAVISGLVGRYDGRVLVVAAASPKSDLVTGLIKDAGPDLAGRVRKASAEPEMDYPARVGLVRELLPGLPAQAIERIARRTATFGEVFAVAATDMVAGLGPGTGAGEAVAAADAVIGAVLGRGMPSREAAVLAWAGGALHERQADACLRVLGAGRVEGDVHVRRAGPLACLADPASPRCTEQAAAFSAPSTPGWPGRSWPLPGRSRPIPGPGWRTGW